MPRFAVRFSKQQTFYMLYARFPDPDRFPPNQCFPISHVICRTGQRYLNLYDMISTLLLTAAVSAAEPSALAVGKADTWARAARTVQTFANHLNSNGRHKRDACDAHLQVITNSVVDFTKFQSECLPWLAKIGDSTEAAYLCESKCAAPFMEVVKRWGSDSTAQSLCAGSESFGDAWDTFQVFDNMFTLLICSKNPVNNKYCYDAMKELAVASAPGDAATAEVCNDLGNLGCCMNVVFDGIPADAELKAFYEKEGLTWNVTSADVAPIWKSICKSVAPTAVDKMFVEKCPAATVGSGIAESTIPYTTADGSESFNGGADGASSATNVAAGVAVATLAMVSWGLL